MLYFQLIHVSSQSYTLCKGYACLGKLRCLSLKTLAGEIYRLPLKTKQMNIGELRNAFARFQMPVTLTSNVNNATYLITVHTTRQLAFARFQMPVTLRDYSTHSKTTRETKWTPVRDKALGQWQWFHSPLNNFSGGPNWRRWTVQNSRMRPHYEGVLCRK